MFGRVMAEAEAVPRPAVAGDETDTAANFEAQLLSQQRLVYNVCYRLLHERCAAEDACQETLIAAWRHRHGGALNRSWLMQIAVNKCRDELRRRMRKPTCLLEENDCGPDSYVSTEPAPEEVAMRSLANAMLQEALLELSWPQRVVLVLCDVEGWPYRDTAQATGVSVGTVKSRVARGRVKLREALLRRAAAGYISI
jgi:RNA polymerase sigma-70 factor (ECF subfamily)